MRKFKPIFLLLTLVTIFFFRNIFLGEVFYFGDNLSLFLPVVTFFTRQLKEGRLPLWNPYLFAGVPLIGDFGLGIFNPLNFFFFFLPPLWALTSLAITEVFLAAVFTYLLLKKWQVGEFAATLGAVVFAFSATMMTFINNISLLSSAYFLPLIFLAGEQVLSKATGFWPIILAVFASLQLVSGHPQPTFYTLTLLFLYFFFYPRLSFTAKVKRGLVFLGFFLGLGAFVLLPFMELVNRSTRPAGDFSYLTAWSMHPLLLIRFFFPSFFGAAVKGFSWGPAYRLVADNTGYFGIVPLFILFTALPKIKKNFPVIFFSIVFLTSIVLAMGKYTPLYGLICRIIPGFNLFRSPTQILLVTNFSASVLVAFSWLAFDSLIKKNKLRRLVYGFLIGCFISTVILGLILLIRENLFVLFYPWLEKVYWWYRKVPLQTSLFHNFNVDRTIFEALVSHLLLTSSILTGFLLSLYLYQRKIIGSKLFRVIIFLLIIYQLFLFNRNNYFSIKASVLNDQQPVAEFVGDGYHRFISSTGYWPFTGLNVYWENISLRPPFAPSVFTPDEQVNFTELKSRLRSLPPNWGLFHQLATPMGYGDLVLSDYAHFMSQDTGRINVNEVDSLPLTDFRLDLLGVKYFLVDANFTSTINEIGNFPQYRLVKEIKNVKIYENRTVLPRAFLDDNGERTAVEIVNYYPNEIDLATKADKPSQLVLTDVFYPGWEVLVDGRPQSIKKYENIFRAVDILPGSHQVKFVFRPQSYYRGLMITITSFLTIGLLVLKRLLVFKKNKYL
ncbi:MAG TPA: YfhO family protein [Candidatus Bathyarchaeia archaeon]|nr:YfhO family protein [Candidatus Bathyarchaeia archaeon]